MRQTRHTETGRDRQDAGASNEVQVRGVTRGFRDSHSCRLPSPSAGHTVCALDPLTPLGFVSLCSWLRTQGGGTRCQIGRPRPRGWQAPQPIPEVTPTPTTASASPNRWATPGRRAGPDASLPVPARWAVILRVGQARPKSPGRAAGRERLPARSCANGDAGPPTRCLGASQQAGVLRPCPAAQDAADGPRSGPCPSHLRGPVSAKAAVTRHLGQAGSCSGHPATRPSPRGGGPPTQACLPARGPASLGTRTGSGVANGRQCRFRGTHHRPPSWPF